jgi:hypothetical protein
MGGCGRQRRQRAPGSRARSVAGGGRSPPRRDRLGRAPSVRVRARLALARCAKRHSAGTLDSRVGAHGSECRNHAGAGASDQLRGAAVVATGAGANLRRTATLAARPRRARGGPAPRRSHRGESEHGERDAVSGPVPIGARRTGALLVAKSGSIASPFAQPCFSENTGSARNSCRCRIVRSAAASPRVPPRRRCRSLGGPHRWAGTGPRR